MLKLQTVRKTNGFTQKQVAEYLGMAVQSYQRIEYGERGTNVRNWDKLEELFNISQKELRKKEQTQ